MAIILAGSSFEGPRLLGTDFDCPCEGVYVILCRVEEGEESDGIDHQGVL